MIKDVFNNIMGGAESVKVSVSGGSLGNQAGETQGFFGKMFAALQQENQNGEANENKFSEGEHVAFENTGDSESKEGRDAVKQALLNLINHENISSKEDGNNRIKSSLGQTISNVVSDETGDQSGETGDQSDESPIGKIEQSTEQAEKVVETGNNLAIAENLTDGKTNETAPSENKILSTLETVRVIPENQMNSKASNTELNASVQLEGERESGLKLNTQTVVNEAASAGQQTAKVEINTEGQVLSKGKVDFSGQVSEMPQSAEKTNAEQTTAVTNGEKITEIKTSADESNLLKTLNRDSVPTDHSNLKTETQKLGTLTDNQVQVNKPNVQTEEVTKPLQQMTQKQVSKNELNAQLHIQNEVKAQHASEERAKRYDFVAQNSDGGSPNGERLEAVSGSGNSAGNQQGATFSDTPNWLKFQTANQQKTGEVNNQQQTFVDEHIKEMTHNADDVSADKSQNAMNRLGEFPIQNALIRRSVLPGLTSVMQKATSSGNEISQNWQKHSFELEDGNKIELSTRNSDGVIQLKIASTNHELSKLLQQYGQEIKEHLEKECELNIDLQFSEEQEESLGSFFSDSSSTGNNNTGLSGTGASVSESSKSKEPLQQSVRRFGYNQMEWTA